MQIAVSSASLSKSTAGLLFSFSFLISAVFAILLVASLYGASTFSFRHGHSIISKVEYLYRCGLYPDLSQFLPLLNALEQYYEEFTCWSNSLGLFNRLLSTKYLSRAASLCVNGTTAVDLAHQIIDIVSRLFRATVLYLASNPFLFTYPLYPVVTFVDPLATNVSTFLTCECQLLLPLYNIVLEPWHNATLFCGLHQLFNGALGFPQVIGRYITDVLITAAGFLSQGNIYAVLKLFFTPTPTTTFYFYLWHFPFEKVSAGILYLGNWLDAAFRNAVCVIVSEAESGSIDDAAVAVSYRTCRNTMEPIQVFCIVSKPLIAVVRTGRIGTEVILNVVRFFNPFDDFRQTQWNPDIIWDSLRDPLPYLATSQIAGPASFVNLSDCNASYAFTNDTVICRECNQISNTSLEECFCNKFIDELDTLIDNSIHLKILRPIFCQFLFGLVRLAISLGKFGTDNVRVFPFGTLPYLANYTTWDSIFDEIGGPTNTFTTGIVYAPIALVQSLAPQYPSLTAIPSIVSYPAKFLSESGRMVFHLFANVCNDFISTPAPFPRGGFTANYLCVNRTLGTYCIQMETALQWLRIPRQLDQLQNDRVPLNITAGNATLEFFCQLINGAFLDSLNISELKGFDLPDTCCTIYNGGTTITELYKFIIEFILSIIQTIIELSSYGDPFDRIFILDYLSCLGNTNTSPCSNINAALNDLTAILSCGCVTVDGIENIPGVREHINTAPLDCLCNSFNGITSVVANSLIELRNIAQLITGTFDCIDVNTRQFRNTTECRTILPEKMADLFTRINTIFGLIGISAENFVCAFASLLDYTCVNTIDVFCIVIDFDGQVRQECPTFNPLDPITNNSFPTPAQYADCVSQCGSDICMTANLTITAIALAGVTDCPNPCAVFPCQPRDKLKVLAGDIWKFIQGFLQIITNLLADIFLFAVNQAGANAPNPPSFSTFSLSGYTNMFLTALGNGLFGTTVGTWGALQALGDSLSCMIGPPGCLDTGANNFEAQCFGSLFITIGNFLQPIYAGAVKVVVDVVALAEFFLGGPGYIGANSAMLEQLIENFVGDLFTFVFADILGNIQSLFEAIGAFIASILSWIIGFGSLYSFNYTNIFYPIIHAILLILRPFFVALQSLVSVVNFFQSLKRDGSVDPAILEFQMQYNLTNVQMTLLQDPQALAQTMTDGTWCRRTMIRLATMDSYTSMSPGDEIAFRFCYSMAILPIVNNANPDKVMVMPLDVTYNTETALSTILNGIDTVSTYTTWNDPLQHILSLLPWPGSKKRGTADALINTIPYGDNISQFLVDQELLDPNNTQANVAWQLIQYRENDMIRQQQYNSRNYLTQIQSYLSTNPGHFDNYDQNGTYSRFTLYYSSYRALLGANFNNNAKKRVALQEAHQASLPLNLQKPKRVLLDKVLRTAYYTLRYTIPKLITQGRTAPEKKRQLSVGATASINALRLAFYSTYVDRINLIGSSIYYIFDKHVIGKIRDASDTKINEMSTIIKRATMKRQTEGSSRLSIPDRIFLMHAKLSKINFLNHFVPALPDVIAEQYPKVGAEQLITVNCSCNCSFVENFLQDAINTWTFCYETLVLNRTITFRTYNGPLIELSPYNGTDSGNLLVNWVQSLFGIDLFQTVLDFVEQTNRLPYTGPVGLLYFAQPLIPFFSLPCERVNLTCELGLGLEWGIIITLAVIIVYAILVFSFLPSVAGLVQTVIIGLGCSGSLVFGASMLIAGISWGYEAKCYLPQEGTLLGYAFGISFLPLFPQCAGKEVNRFLQTYLITPRFLESFSFLGFMDILETPSQSVYLAPGGYTCPNHVNIASAYDHGITSIGSIIGMTLVRYWPGLAQWLQYSCLVRGGCLQVLMLSNVDPMLQEDGWWPFNTFFTGYNATAFAANSDPVLNFWYWADIWTLFVVLLILIILAPILAAIVYLVIDMLMLLVVIFTTMFSHCQYEEDVYVESESTRFLGDY